mmetsp:Transcript_10079/g.18343  ORF Transcript_10079/g.18343 Transcript_10079/m.18343 type:complete len:791 (-) Transcript_10079:6-2378(-)
MMRRAITTAIGTGRRHVRVSRQVRTASIHTNTIASRLSQHEKPANAVTRGSLVVGTSRTFRTLSGEPASASTTASMTANKDTGTLFSVPGLRQPADFCVLAANAIRTCDGIRADLASIADSNEPPQSVEEARRILHTLDDISNTVCSVIDAAELCRSVHVSSKWRESASNAFDQMSQYISHLNADTNLYGALSLVLRADPSSVLNQFTPEEQRFASLMKFEFERDGIHLPTEQRTNVIELQHHVTQLESQFQHNITNSRSAQQATIQLNAAEVERIIPRHILQHHNIAMSDDETTIQLPTDSPLAHSVGRFSANGEVRREVYMGNHTLVPENLQVLDALIHMRHELATTGLGYQSYAHWFLQDKMSRHPDHALQFLNSVQGALDRQGGFKRDMEEIQRAKKIVEPQSSSTIEAWDVPFYTALLKSKDAGSGDSLDGFLTLDACIEGMSLLVHRLFGITMTPTPMDSSEKWDILTDTDTDATTAGTATTKVQKFTFTEDKSERPVGTMYLDLHPREGKYVHAAHFTVQCGCTRSPSSHEQDNNNINSNNQLPIIALVCNLSAGASSSERTASTVLSHNEVETLFHEFGHALHSLLSRTSFQHLSGTRAAMDFVETPSHLMENFVWDPQFLSLMARHYSTGQAPSSEQISHLVQSRYRFRSIDVQTQIVYSLFDQSLFGGNYRNNSSTELFAELHQSHGLPYAKNTHWHSRFGHLVTYGAAYYGYLYSQVFAADIWTRTFVQPGDTLSRASGEKVWRDMLIHGGARDPHLMLKDVLGGAEPTADSYVDSMKL